MSSELSRASVRRRYSVSAVRWHEGDNADLSSQSREESLAVEELLEHTLDPTMMIMDAHGLGDDNDAADADEEEEKEQKDHGDQADPDDGAGDIDDDDEEDTFEPLPVRRIPAPGSVTASTSVHADAAADELHVSQRLGERIIGTPEQRAAKSTGEEKQEILRQWLTKVTNG